VPAAPFATQLEQARHLAIRRQELEALATHLRRQQEQVRADQSQLAALSQQLAAQGQRLQQEQAQWLKDKEEWPRLREARAREREAWAKQQQDWARQKAEVEGSLAAEVERLAQQQAEIDRARVELARQEAELARRAAGARPGTSSASGDTLEPVTLREEVDLLRAQLAQRNSELADLNQVLARERKNFESQRQTLRDEVNGLRAQLDEELALIAELQQRGPGEASEPALDEESGPDLDGYDAELREFRLQLEADLQDLQDEVLRGPVNEEGLPLSPRAEAARALASLERMRGEIGREVEQIQNQLGSGVTLRSIPRPAPESVEPSGEVEPGFWES
jgi:chromosome segregation ATPase